ncbi:hypothetical protein ABT284_29235, partial [Nocardioides sp. NPDC000441]
RTAGEGGAWGIAVLAAYARAAEAEGDLSLSTYLAERVFGDIDLEVVEPDAADLAGFRTYLERYEAGLDIERAAVVSLAPNAAEGDQ